MQMDDDDEEAKRARTSPDTQLPLPPPERLPAGGEPLLSGFLPVQHGDRLRVVPDADQLESVIRLVPLFCVVQADEHLPDALHDIGVQQLEC